MNDWSENQNDMQKHLDDSHVSKLLFLPWSRYRNLIEKALKARLVYRSPHMNRSVSFEYMNRQLVWNEFSVGLLLRVAYICQNHFKSLATYQFWVSSLTWLFLAYGWYSLVPNIFLTESICQLSFYFDFGRYTFAARTWALKAENVLCPLSGIWTR